MWLAVDAGNSRVKWATVDNNRMHRACAADYSQLSALAKAAQTAECVCVSDVRGDKNLRALLQSRCARVLFLRSRVSACGVQNNYCPPQSLGVDRWLALIAARGRVSGAAVVASFGTALTVDALDGDGQFLGGIICPGAALMLKSLSDNTVLPDATNAIKIPPRLPPQNTGDGMVGGVYFSLAAAACSFWKKFLPEATMIIGGGDAQTILPLLNLLSDARQKIRREKNLVLDGIVRLRAETK